MIVDEAARELGMDSCLGPNRLFALELQFESLRSRSFQACVHVDVDLCVGVIASTDVNAEMKV